MYILKIVMLMIPLCGCSEVAVLIFFVLGALLLGWSFLEL